jgi:hypothetical protein
LPIGRPRVANLTREKRAPGGPIPWRHIHRINAAHDRSLKAVATLARVRKLALPALQVNIARNHVHMT